MSARARSSRSTSSSLALAIAALAATVRGLSLSRTPRITAFGAFVAMANGTIVAFELCTAAVYIALRATG
jgi:predicted exporter